MKKGFIFLLAVLLCAAVCFPAFADMGGPEFIGYKAKTKVDTEYYEQDWDEETDESHFRKLGSIPAGTELEIINEYKIDGVMYGRFDEAPSLGGASGYVRVQDLSVDGREDYPPVTAYKQSTSLRMRVTDPNGVTLYAGPSGSYAKVGVIPQNAEVTVDTLDQQNYDSSSWMYLTYGSMRGWAYCWLYEGAFCPMAELLPEGESGTLWVVRDNAVLTDKNGNKLVTVPKGEKLTFNAYNRSPHVLVFYVTYQGKSGSFSADDDGFDNVVASSLNDGIIYDPPVKKDASVNVYAYPDDKTPIGNVRYQAGDTLKSEFTFYSDPLEGYRGGVEWVHVDKDGQSGWIRLGDLDLEYPESYEGYTYEIPALYMSESTQTKVTAQPQAADDTAAPATQAADDTAVFTAQAEAAASEADVSAEFSAQASEPAVGNGSGRVLAPSAIIGICIGAAAVLALTAFVTLRLIRRKKTD